MNQPKVSVSLITYKQEKFIAECLDSLLSQKVNFNFEIVVADDCSPDKTGEIVEEYGKKYPSIVKAIRRPKNLGMVRNAITTISECRGNYIALMEGDDIWLYDNKLQVQADFLDKNPDCAFCFTNQFEFDEGYRDKGKAFYTSANRPPEKFDLDHFLRKNPTILVPNNSKMFRREVQPEYFPDWFFSSLQWDWVLHVLQAKKGKFGYVDYVTLGYRRHSGAAVTVNNSTELALSGLKTLKFLNGYLDYKYDWFCSRTSWHYNLLAFSYLEKKKYFKFLYYYIIYFFNIKQSKEFTIKNDLWKLKKLFTGRNLEVSP